MTLYNFYENLGEIDFDKGHNSQTLEDYLLACLTLLDLHRHKQPSYELFLLIYDQARNGSKANYNLFWKEHYKPKMKLIKPKFSDLIYWKNILKKIRTFFRLIYKEEDIKELSEWESVRDSLRSLAVDLINTRNVRGENNYKNEENEWGEWFTEKGEKFYNGNTPDAILAYAARRWTEKVSLKSYEKDKITWGCFSDPIWFGIKYE